MAETNENRWGEGVVITAPVLRAASFEWDGDGVPSLEDAAVEYRLRVTRLDEVSIAVDFSVGVAEIPGLTLDVAHRMTARLKPDSPEASDPERALRLFAAKLAPRSIYPFAREALASFASRAYFPAFVLPITNIANLFVPEEIEFPDLDSGE